MQELEYKINNTNGIIGGNGIWFHAPIYPCYLDLKLAEVSEVDKVEVEFSKNKEGIAEIYSSIDGVNFNHFQKGEKLGYIRVFCTYQKGEEGVFLDRIKIIGEKTGEKTEEEISLTVCEFQECEFDREITKEDTIKEVYGMIERTIGRQYKDWFLLSLEEKDKNYFMLDMEENKIKVASDTGVGLAYGINYYLKYYCFVNISRLGGNLKMPEKRKEVKEKKCFHTKAEVRYAMNYCTHSYSMAFWGEEEWQKEIDYMAWNGINLVLDITAQVEVYRRFMEKIGYSQKEIKNYICGPAYQAWAFMANIYGIGGPVSDRWFEKRTKLARKNQRKMRILGMNIVLQGFSGMIPVDIKTKDKEAQIIAQGLWCNLPRPAMLKTNTKSYEKYAELFYESQREVLGNISRFFATDPFHEGGCADGLNKEEVGRAVIKNMKAYRKDAVWVIQSWGENPSEELLKGLEEDKQKHVLILDLYAEKAPRWETWAGKEFGNTPWVYCMLNNFGGRLGLRGYLDTIVKEGNRISKQNYWKGIGITPEAINSNPMLNDLFFETIWSEEEINLEKWLWDYSIRRYGKEQKELYQALLIWKDTAYNSKYNTRGEGAAESIINARPKMDIDRVCEWGNTKIEYEKEKFKHGTELFLKDCEELKEISGYTYDAADLKRQVLANEAEDIYQKMCRAFQQKERDKFLNNAEEFLKLIDLQEENLQSCEEFSLSKWLRQAEKAAEGMDEFTKDLYQLNARALVTTWYSKAVSEQGKLHEYANRQWSGLTKDFYKKRWEMWIEEKKRELLGEKAQKIEFYDWEWKWVLGKEEI